MAGRFQGKTVPTGRITPSALGPSAATTSTTSSISSSSHTAENDQTYLGKISLEFPFDRRVSLDLDRIKAKEIISEAFLQVVRMKPDDPIDFLYS